MTLTLTPSTGNIAFDPLVQYFSSGGTIPLQIVTTTNWPQFVISVIVALLGSFFVFLILGKPIVERIKEKIHSRKIRKLYKGTNRHYIVVKHSNPKGLFDTENVMIDREMHMKIVKLIQSFNGEPFDLYLHTPGGEIFATQAISRVIKNYPGEVRAIVPLYAMSGGTLLTLSCDKILMGETSVLGPVDPQLGNLFKIGSAKAWEKIVKMKGKKAEDSSISFAIMGKQYTNTLKKIITSLLDKKVKDKKKLKRLVDLLTSGDVEHGYPIIKKDLRKLGLKVLDIKNDYINACNHIINSKYSGVYGE